MKALKRSPFPFTPVRRVRRKDERKGETPKVDRRSFSGGRERGMESLERSPAKILWRRLSGVWETDGP